MSRYKAVEGSDSGHCCFEGSVLDMQLPYYHCDDVNQALEPLGYKCICECFDYGDAVVIADSLNKMEYV